MGRAFEYRKAAKLKRWGHMARTFTKIGKQIAIAVKAGGPDPDTNPHLRAVIQTAKRENMPNANVERAIKNAMGFSFWKIRRFYPVFFDSLDIFFIILYPRNALFYEIHFMTSAIKWMSLFPRAAPLIDASSAGARLPCRTSRGLGSLCRVQIVGALFAPTLTFWGRFLPPLCCFGGAFCPHTSKSGFSCPDWFICSLIHPVQIKLCRYKPLVISPTRTFSISFPSSS